MHLVLLESKNNLLCLRSEAADRVAQGRTKLVQHSVVEEKIARFCRR